MNVLTISLIGLGLSMDCFAVSVASGLAIKELKIHHILRIAFFFGLFQALMPVIGWFAGMGFRSYIENYDHWIAFGLLAAIGVKMIYESRTLEEEEKSIDPRKIFVLLALSVATSIDALAVGLSLSFLKVAILTPAAIFGAITFAVSLAGIFIGDKFGHLFEKYVELAGGLILIAIGSKILIQHLAHF